MKQRRQIGVLLALVLIAAVVWLWNFRGKPVVVADATPNIQDDPVLQIPNPQIRLDQIERARKAEYRTSGRNPFSPAQAPQSSKPHPDVKPDFPGPKDQPPPPPPPPLTLPPNVKFFGFGTVPNGSSRRAFFTEGDDVHVVAEGEVLLNRFRILRIGNANVEFEEISSGRRGVAPLVEEQAGGQ